MSHVTCRMSHVTCLMSNAYVDPWDMLNNFCFHVYAQMSLFMGENVNDFFLTSGPSPVTRVTNSGCKRCNFMKTDEIICDAGANGTNSRVEVMQNVSKIS